MFGGGSEITSSSSISSLTSFLITQTVDLKSAETNGRSKPSSNHLDVVPPVQSNGQASDDASTRTQPGSRAISERDTEGVPTPFSYTGHAIGSVPFIAHGDSEIRTAATYGPHLGGHTNLMRDPQPEMNGP